MYHPYFRGKQFELLAIRETAGLMANAQFVPIIEPVKEALNGLDRTLKAICDANGKAIVIVNPDYGDHASDGTDISKLLQDNFGDKKTISAGVLLKESMSADIAYQYYETHKDHSPVFIHAGFTEPKVLADKLQRAQIAAPHVFVEKYCGKLYWRHFKGSQRVLIRDVSYGARTQTILRLKNSQIFMSHLRKKA